MKFYEKGGPSGSEHITKKFNDLKAVNDGNKKKCLL